MLQQRAVIAAGSSLVLWLDYHLRWVHCTAGRIHYLISSAH